jgi:cyclophilin family peptidyl-prolyl cis-trans isomerase
VVTTKGEMVVRARRNWSPLGVDRFYTLVRNQYFDSVAFHRTINKFVAQFGIHGDTAVSRAWRGKSFADEPVKVANQKGTLSYARGGPNTRSIQLFFNTVDNTPRLDTLNTFGFPPIAQVIRGHQRARLAQLGIQRHARGPDVSGPVAGFPHQAGERVFAAKFSEAGLHR